MALMTWRDEEYSVNISHLDGHHKRLFGLVNTLHDAMKQKETRDVLGKVFSELLDYTVYHFRAEEELFEKYAYPDYQSHKNEHEDLTKQALELKSKFDADKFRITLTMETMEFLRDWLNNHIRVVDKKYGPFLNSKGVR